MVEKEKMTKTQKEKWLERLIWFVGSILISMVVIGWQNKGSDQKDIKETIIRLDETKASKEELNKKCLETKQEIKKDIDEKFSYFSSDIDEIKRQQVIQNEDTKEILRYLRPKK
jgi:hypothetical protein